VGLYDRILVTINGLERDLQTKWDCVIFRSRLCAEAYDVEKDEFAAYFVIYLIELEPAAEFARIPSYHDCSLSVFRTGDVVEGVRIGNVIGSYVSSLWTYIEAEGVQLPEVEGADLALREGRGLKLYTTERPKTYSAYMRFKPLEARDKEEAKRVFLEELHKVASAKVLGPDAIKLGLKW